MRLVTFNCQRGVRSARTAARAAPPADRGIDVALLATVCASFDADVLALQEVTGDQPPVVARACEMSVVFGAAIPGYGNALLARGDIVDVDVVALPFSAGREPRSAIIARVAGVSIAATHLGLRGDAYTQLPLVVAALLARPLPHVLLGDLNVEDPDVAPLSLVPSQPTFPADAPVRCIDHVATNGLRVFSVDVLDEPAVGDHRPVAVLLEQHQPTG